MEYSDFILLVNLVLVTVIYSSFISPSLRKLSELKSDVTKTAFPFPANNASIDAIKEAGVNLKKAITQYEDLYEETRHFLIFFYIILTILFVLQLVLLCVDDSLSLAAVLRLGVALFIIILLVIALNRFITPPSRLRTIQWLRSHGIGSAYYRKLLDPTLEVNLSLMNVREDKSEIKIAMKTGIHLIGYSYLLTIESTDGDKLYYMSAGTTNKHSRFGITQSSNGLENRTLRLMRAIKLKPRQYKVSLYVFESPFPGTYKTHITTLNVNGNSGEFKSQSVPIDFNDFDSPCEFTTDNKYRITSINTPKKDVSDALHRVIVSKQFLRYFKKRSRISVSLYSHEGIIDSPDIKAAFSLRNIFISSIIRWFSQEKRDQKELQLLKK